MSERHQLENSEQFLVGVHPADRCAGESCTIHNRSDHPLRHLPQVWNGEYMERYEPAAEGETGRIWQDPDSPHPQARPNAARCMDCGVLLYSRFRHDFKQCACPNNTMVDGGSAYIRRGGKNLDRIEEITSWPVPAGWR